MKYHIPFAFLSLLASAFALVDYYSLNNNKVLQSCAYVSNAEGFIPSKFRSNDPSIRIHFPDSPDNNEINVYTLIMGGEDLNKATIGLNPYYKVCDEYALQSGYCEHESDEANSKKMTLADLIDSNAYTHPIESFMLNSKGEDHFYTLDKSGIYCVLFLSSEINESSDSKFIVEVDWIQAFGSLLVSDFSRMFSAVYFSIAYATVAIILSLLTYRKLKNDGKTAITLDTFKHKKYTLQYKFILFFWAYSSLFLISAINYLLLNKYGYSTNIFLVPLTNLLFLVMSTLITVWLIYNLMLFSAGAWFEGFKHSSLKLYTARVVSITLIVEMLLYDFESSNIYSLIGNSKRDFLSTIIYIEYIMIMILCLVWALLTTYSINDKKMKNIFYISIILLSLLFSTIVFGAYIFSSTVQASILANSIEFVFTIILTALWFNVVYENNQLSLKM